MKVGISEGAKVIELYQGSLARGAGQQGGNAPAPSDQADISQKGKDLARIMFSLKALPDVRGDVVSTLKQQVSSGTYKVDPSRVVEGMLRERQLYKEAVGK